LSLGLEISRDSIVVFKVLVFDISILILLMVLDLLEPVRVADVSKQSHSVLSQLIKFCFVVFCKPKAWPQKRSKTWFGG